VLKGGASCALNLIDELGARTFRLRLNLSLGTHCKPRENGASHQHKPDKCSVPLR
jgi:hypothetical protein